MTSDSAWKTIDSAPKGEFGGDDFIGYLDDGQGGWIDLCAWSGLHKEFMPRVCLPDPTNWRADCQARGTRITHWMPLPAHPDAALASPPKE